MSLAYPAVQVVPVPVGLTVPLLLPFDAVGAKQALILEGINRSCLDAFGTALQQQLRSRALGFTIEHIPIFLGTLGDGPSCIPPSPHLLEFGPMFDTDVLSWDLQKQVTSIIPGRCEPDVWKLSGDQSGVEAMSGAKFLNELVSRALPPLGSDRHSPHFRRSFDAGGTSAAKPARNGHCHLAGSCPGCLRQKETCPW